MPGNPVKAYDLRPGSAQPSQTQGTQRPDNRQMPGELEGAMTVSSSDTIADQLYHTAATTIATNNTPATISTISLEVRRRSR